MKETKELVVFLANVANVTADVLEDKKFTFAEALKFVPCLMDLSPAINGYDKILGELENSDAASQAQLRADVMAELDFSVNVEAIVDAAINSAISVVKLIQAIKG